MNEKELITLDFDGVLHAYTTPFTTADKVEDGAVPGAIKWLLEALDEYDIAVFSARSSQPGGIPAMRQWLKRELILWLSGSTKVKDIIARAYLANYQPKTSDSHYEMCVWADGIVNRIQWPITKIPSKLYIDDNAHRFEGKFPKLSAIKDMNSWVKET